MKMLVAELNKSPRKSYCRELMASGTIDGIWLRIEFSEYSRISAEFSSGLGTFTESVLNLLGIRKGPGCQCATRRDKLNRRFPPSYFIEPISLAVLIVWTAVAAILIL